MVYFVYENNKKLLNQMFSKWQNMFLQYYYFQFLLSIPIVSIAKFLLKRRWGRLKKNLHKEYNLIKIDQNFNPPLLLQRILISGEDHRYFYHSGFDVIAICRAIWRRVAWGVHEGASTIEQQIVRVLTNLNNS